MSPRVAHRTIALFIVSLAALEACDDTGGAGGQGAGASGADGETTATGAGSPTSASGAGNPTASGSGPTSSSTGTPPNCAASSDCEACGAVQGCGWCGATGTCVAGNGGGPTGGTCDAGWLAQGDLFSCIGANCASHTDCDSCDSNTGCGFCVSSGKCIAGSPEGPAPQWGTCDADSYYYSACPSDCANKFTCISCGTTNANSQTDAGCGWCTATNTCMPGNVAGPTMGGSCASGWAPSGTLDQCL